MATPKAQGSPAPTQAGYDAHHEAGHAFMIHVWGWPHKGIYRQPRPATGVGWATSFDDWGTAQPFIDPNMPYDEVGIPTLPKGSVKPIGLATQYCAGRMAEVLLAEGAGQCLLDEWTGYDAQRFRKLAQEENGGRAEAVMQRWEALTRRILSHPACWYAVKELAGVLLQRPDLPRTT